MTCNGTARLELAGVSKTFGTARVLSGVDLRVDPGEILGLAGQNGSGKSTLIKILTGVYSPDPGASLFVDGNPIRIPVRWPVARRAGISVVHQDLGLLDGLTVAENICVGGFPTTRLGRIDRLARDRLAENTLARLGVDVSPQALVGGLAAAERAEVAIARALRDHAPGKGIMILDESTRSLRGNDLDRVHAMLRRIVEDGSSAILISHSLKELTSVTQHVTVLRDGHVVANALSTASLVEADIARAMLGETVARFRHDGVIQDALESPCVVATGVQGRRARAVDFEVGRGEVLGITGLPGSGYEEIPYLLAGATPSTAGTVRVDNQFLELARGGVVSSLRAGVVLVPERRDRDGLALELSVQDNMCLPRLRSRRRPFFLSRKWQGTEARQAIDEHGIRASNPHALVRQLSGGNQQKVLLAKWLAVKPKLLILHEPTQAVDVGARHDILKKISAAARQGTSVLVVSSEPDDLTSICDRVLIYQPEGGLLPGEARDVDTLIEQIFAPPTAIMTRN